MLVYPSFPWWDFLKLNLLYLSLDFYFLCGTLLRQHQDLTLPIPLLKVTYALCPCGHDVAIDPGCLPADLQVCGWQQVVTCFRIMTAEQLCSLQSSSQQQKEGSQNLARAVKDKGLTWLLEGLLSVGLFMLWHHFVYFLKESQTWSLASDWKGSQESALECQGDDSGRCRPCNPKTWVPSP